jgi:hypothetical protein
MIYITFNCLKDQKMELLAEFDLLKSLISLHSHKAMYLLVFVPLTNHLDFDHMKASLKVNPHLGHNYWNLIFLGLFPIQFQIQLALQIVHLLDIHLNLPLSFSFQVI